MRDEANSPLPDALQRVLISPHSQYRGLFRGLIRHLHGRGSKICIVTPNPQREDYWRKAAADLPGVEFARNDRRYSVVREPVADEASLFKRAADYEAQLGVTINQLAVRDRHLGRGYAPGGFFHPRSQMSERSSYAQMVAAFVAELDFWSAEFGRFKPTLVVNCGELAWRRAVQADVPYRVLAGSRYKGLHQWAHTEFFENPEVRRTYERLSGDFSPLSLDQPYTGNLLYVSRFAERCRVFAILKENILQVLRLAYWKVRGYEKARGYFLSEDMQHPWLVRRAYRRMKGVNTAKLEDLRSQNFVYYPLHTEPEAALQGLSPEYTFQLETIVRLSRLMPAGVLLAVKETQPALGRRPTNFYDQIVELKNVKMLNIEERGIDVVSAATAIATITGTAGFEATLIGKPVISFGRHNQYNFLPNVHVVTDCSSLEAAIVKVLKPQGDAGMSKTVGSRFLEAVKAISFDLGTYDFTNPEHVDPAMTDDMFMALVRSSDAIGKA